MKAQIVEQVELFSEAELESLEFSPEELEAIEQERVPDLDSISFEDIAEDLDAVLETGRPRTGRPRPTSVPANSADLTNKLLRKQRTLIRLTEQYKKMSNFNPFKLLLKRRINALRRELGI